MGIENVKNIEVLGCYQVTLELSDGKKAMTQLFADSRAAAASRAAKIYQDRQKKQTDDAEPEKENKP